MVWAPRVTVAAVIEHDGRFLLVDETADGQRVLNQPAGHLDPGESLIDAVVREVLEETGRPFEPEAVVGIYLWTHPDNGLTFLRVAFCGRVGERVPGRALDHGIHDTPWLSLPDLEAQRARHRSPLVERCLRDYLAGQRHPLDLLERVVAGGTP